MVTFRGASSSAHACQNCMHVAGLQSLRPSSLCSKSAASSCFKRLGLGRLVPRRLFVSAGVQK